MEITKVNPSSHNAKPNPTQTTQTKRLRRPSTTTTGDGPIPQRKRLRLSPTCYPAFFHLKQELGYRSDADVLQWLIHQARPQLLPAPSPPNSPANRPSRNSVSKPLCMQYRITDKLASASSPAPATPRSPIRATVVQASTVFFDTPATLDKAERLIATAAAYGSQMVVFPEAFIGGYPRLMMRFEGDDLQKYRASAIDVPGPEIERLGKIAGKHKVHLVMGVVERTKCCLFSTVVFFDSNGNRLGKQQKLMLLPSETAIWHSGNKSRFPVFPTAIGNIGGLTCWDNKSPFLRSELYAHGVELYCAPSSDEREVWKASMIHVAVEGCCFVLSANQFCRRQDYPLRQGEDVSAEEVACLGGSLIVSPSGNVLAGPNYQGECLISADLDTREIEKAKIEFGVVRNNFKPNHDDLIASEADQSLISVEVKQVPELLSCDLVT